MLFLLLVLPILLAVRLLYKIAEADDVYMTWFFVRNISGLLCCFFWGFAVGASCRLGRGQNTDVLGNSPARRAASPATTLLPARAAFIVVRWTGKNESA